MSGALGTDLLFQIVRKVSMNATNQCGLGTLLHYGLPVRESFHQCR
jgi:hypothetical protein